MNISPVELRGQYLRAYRLWSGIIGAAADANGIGTWFLYAIGSRETNLANITSDDGHGHGIWQADDRSQEIPSPFSIKDQAMIAARLLRTLLEQNHGSHPYAAAAYNAGPAGLAKGLEAGNFDVFTTGGDYGADVDARRRWLINTFA